MNRPAVVTVAVLVQALIAIGAAALIAIMWLGYLHYDKLITRAAELVPDTDPFVVESERTSNLAGTVIVTVILGCVMVGFAATAWPTWRGSDIARIFTCVGSGVIGAVAVLYGVCGGVMGLLLLPLLDDPVMTDEPPFPVDEGDPFADPDFFAPEPFHEELARLDSGMWQGLAISFAPLLSVLAIAVLVLLLLPPANRWFSLKSRSSGFVPLGDLGRQAG